MTLQINSWVRFFLVVVLLAAAGQFLSARSGAEDLPPRQSLAFLPNRLGDWVGQDSGIPPEILAVLGRGEFLSRIYRRAPDQAPVDLFLAYFPSQRSGNTIHSPKNCLPGAGWTPVESSRIWLERPGRTAIPANRYVVARGAERLLVLYWYQAHDRAVANEYWAKFCLVVDAFRMNRTDGALVRIVTPLLAPGEGPENGQKRAVEFGQRLLPVLDSYIPQ